MRVRLLVVVMAVGIGLGLVPACGGREPGKTPSGARASCEVDSDCVVADHSGCCKACPDQPFGMPALNAAQLENKCKDLSCTASSDRIDCPKVEPKSAFIAVCRDGTCAANKR